MWYFQGLVLPQVLRSVSCWTDVCLRKNPQISQLMENLGQESDGKGDCVSFSLSSTYNIVGWEIHSLFSAASWLATSHITCTCVWHPHPQPKYKAHFPAYGKNSSQLPNKNDRCFYVESSKKWNKVILQVIALLIQIKFRAAQGNLAIAHSEMYKPWVYKVLFFDPGFGKKS